MSLEKFPRIPHLPWSPGGTSDDKRMVDVSGLLHRPVLITEKWDGSNVCLCRDALYARSHNGPPTHPSFDALKARHATLKAQIPEGIDLFGEWLWARHSLHYANLPDYLLIFAIRSRGTWLAWAEVEACASRLGLTTVAVARTGVYASEEALRQATEEVYRELNGTEGCSEGVVVRVADSFPDSEFSASVAKWVRPNHVTSDSHWSDGPIVRNRLRE